MKRTKHIRRFATAAVVLGAAGVALAHPAGAQGVVDFDRTQLDAGSLMNTIVLDNIFIFIAAVLVLFMQAGFAMVEAGFTEAKNAANIMMKNLMDVSVGMLFFGLIGWNIAYSGANIFGFADGAFSIFGVSGMTDLYPSDALDYPLAVPVDWFFQAAFAATAATIVSGAVSGRTQFKGYLLYSIVLTAIIYPIVVNWKWGGGWLDGLGFVDFAGSGIVHMVGGFAALMGAIVLGPRIAKFDREGNPRTINGHSIPLAILGVFILFVGWFGFNPGSQLQADMAVPYIAVQTALAAAAGATGAMAMSWIVMKKPDVAMAGNGLLAGLVAICSGIGNFSSLGTLATGLVGGVLVVVAIRFVESLKIDDPVGAFSVHGVCGFWGLLATGLFATSGSPVDGSLDGLLYGGGFGLLFDQFVGAMAIALFVTATTGALFLAIRSAGLLRVSVHEELAGLDISEHGSPAYTLNLSHTTPEDSKTRIMTS
jgi:Amt family ammonium transporter